MIGEIENFLRHRIGLDPASIGRSAIEQAVRQRMARSGAPDLAHYLGRLLVSETEQQALVDAVVVPETWFFRNPETFAALAGIAVQRYRAGGRRLRLASLPCATGEEPYSMAMALLDAGLPADAFRIDGIDVSQSAIEAAEIAVYGRNSFRGLDPGIAARHFEQTPKGSRPVAAVRRQVDFALGNLLDPALSLGQARYDILFCRNVLIYFDPETQDMAIRSLSRLLAPDGILFVGAPEASLPLRQGFASLRIPKASAFCRDRALPAANVAPRRRTVVRPTPAPRRAVPLPPVAVQPVAPAPARPPADGGASLTAVQRLADSGRVAEAKQRALVHLRDHGPSPQIYYLLGLLADTAGDGREAVACYRKTLYLDPDHGEALAHLALLLDAQGDRSGAERLNARIRRRAAVR